MGQDIRHMLKNYQPQESKLSSGHDTRFEAKLVEKFHQEKKRNSIFWLKIAAMIIVILSVGYFGYQYQSKGQGDDIILADSDEKNKDLLKTPTITLGDLSPDLKKVEDFYLTGINVQLASLNATPENKNLMDGYMRRLNELDNEYILLNKELSKVGPTEATITALIDNLKLRLELLFKLKNKLKQLKNIENEKFKNLEI